jgi:hypothetical protein
MEGGNQIDIGIIGDESNVDAVFAPYLFQSSSQAIPPLLYENITH